MFWLRRHERCTREPLRPRGAEEPRFDRRRRVLGLGDLEVLNPVFHILGALEREHEHRGLLAAEPEVDEVLPDGAAPHRVDHPHGALDELVDAREPLRRWQAAHL